MSAPRLSSYVNSPSLDGVVAGFNVEVHARGQTRIAKVLEIKGDRARCEFVLKNGEARVQWLRCLAPVKEADASTSAKVGAVKSVRAFQRHVLYYRSRQTRMDAEALQAQADPVAAFKAEEARQAATGWRVDRGVWTDQTRPGSGSPAPRLLAAVRALQAAGDPRVRATLGGQYLHYPLTPETHLADVLDLAEWAQGERRKYEHHFDTAMEAAVVAGCSPAQITAALAKGQADWAEQCARQVAAGTRVGG